MSIRAQHEAVVQDLIEKADWAGVAKECEEYEFTFAEQGVAVTTQNVPLYGIQLLAYYILNDLNSARFLWKRIPSEIRASNTELQAIWTVGKHLWPATRNYPEVYNSLRAVDWHPQYAILVSALEEAFRERTLQLISRAYSMISLKDCANLVGLSDEEMLAFATSLGWDYDDTSNYLRPVKKKVEQEERTSLEQLQQLTEYIVFLEQQDSFNNKQ